MMHIYPTMSKISIGRNSYRAEEKQNTRATTPSFYHHLKPCLSFPSSLYSPELLVAISSLPSPERYITTINYFHRRSLSLLLSI
ncbi:unnamed protein product [Linum tenue]|uniref:Uncharacterized protein n=1 Tax=Linum tenue TaxID=586396 RepID=A0AAV0PYR8_9ROSI|nr:unnamed protein product [Linum tenue]